MIHEVTLSLGERAIVYAIGMARREECIRSGTASHGKTDKYHASDPWGTDINGAGAELAFCKYKNIYWPATVNTFKKPDIAANIEIRSTELPKGRLIIRKRDDLSRYYVLVCGSIPTFNICGWIKGAHGCKDKWLTNPYGSEECWMINQGALLDVDLLKINLSVPV